MGIRKKFPRAFFILCYYLLGSAFPSYSQDNYIDAAAPYISTAFQKNLAQDPVWLRLLHYNRNIFGVKNSDINQENFFLSKDGKQNAQHELNATIQAFFVHTSSADASAVCHYPARFHWLQQQLQLPTELQLECPRYQEWLAKLNPESASLVFASFYMNNPASLYGHTFLKLGRKDYPQNEGLLDYTVNYAAVTDTKNGLMFALRGLAGGYDGNFSTLPYYMQVQKYNNMEARDLWEYELDMDEAALHQLMRHLWELGQASMAYFFFNKNCSYQLLPLLEVAKPGLDVSKGYIFETIPLDTVRTLFTQPNFVKEAHFRPSHIKVMLARRDRLNDSQITLAEDLVQSTPTDEKPVIELKKYAPEQQAFVLDSAYDFLRYKAGFYRDQPKKVQDKEKQLLDLRRPYSDVPTQVVVSTELPPHLGHQSRRAGLAWGINRDESFEEISVRCALQDVEADQKGYVNGSQLEMGHLRARHDNERSKTYLEEFTLIEILALTPWDRWVHPPSWHVRTGAEVSHDLGKDPQDSLYYNVTGGSGFSFPLPVFRKSLIYAMWKGDAALGHVFDDGYRWGLGGSGGVLLEILPWWRLHFQGVAMRYPDGDVSNKVTEQLVNNFTIIKDLEARITLERQNAYQEALASLNFYY